MPHNTGQFDTKPDRLGIAGKLRIVFVLSVIAMGMVCGAAIWDVFRIQSAAMQFFDTGLAGLRRAYAADLALERQRRLVADAQVGGVTTARRAALVAEFSAITAQFTANVSNDGWDWRARDIASPLSRLAFHGEAALRAPDPRRAAAFASDAEMVAASIKDWHASQTAELADFTAELHATTNAMLIWIMTGALAALGVAIIGASAAAGVLRRLGAITAVMSELARNDQVLSVPSLDDADEVGDMARALAVFRDTAAEARRRGDALAAANGMLDAALNNMGQGLIMLDADLRLRVSNRHFQTLHGLPGELLYAGMPLGEILALSRAAGNLPDGDLATMEHKARARLAARRQAVDQRVMGSGRVLSVRRVPMDGGGWVCTYEDITEQNRSVARIAHLSRHDVLTDLPNRAALQDTLRTACREPNISLAVHCVNLDRFKNVNDTNGYDIGDAVLCEVARRLRQSVRDLDLVARLGGDEFAIIQRNVDDPVAVTALAGRLINIMSQPFRINEHDVVIGASIGIAVSSADQRDDARLLRNADLALDRAKQDGGGVWRVFLPEMDEAAQSRRTLEADLRQALDRQEFELFYQPLVSLAERRVKAFEALIRWRHPISGLVPPDHFIPLAEEVGLIVPIGEWVLRTACAEAMGWPANVGVAVNLSPIQFMQSTATGTLAEQVEAALRDSGLSPTRLELEITESLLLQESEPTVAALHRLRALGVRISLDDFGTGYSSLRYLNSFPFDKIKIDKSFVRGLPDGADSSAIVRAIAGLGQSLGIATTAEGVETFEQLQQLIADGCTEVQGYFFSPPRPASEVPYLLEDGARRCAA